MYLLSSHNCIQLRMIVFVFRDMVVLLFCIYILSASAQNLLLQICRPVQPVKNDSIACRTRVMYIHVIMYRFRILIVIVPWFLVQLRHHHFYLACEWLIVYFILIICLVLLFLTFGISLIYLNQNLIIIVRIFE